MSRHWAQIFLLMLLFSGGREIVAASTNDPFRLGTEAYRYGEYGEAVEHLRLAAVEQPSSGALLNLGLAEWHRGQVGAAVLAWEQARWIDPYDNRPRENLAYARQLTGIGSPEYSWYERASAWLPINAWAWAAGVSLWLAVGMVVLPGVLRWRKTAWQQAVAALALAVFFACLPAHYGVLTRTKIGFVLQKNLPLRLTPTAEAEVLMKLAAGEPVRELRVRGGYVLVRTAEGQGWLERSKVGWLCPK